MSVSPFYLFIILLATFGIYGCSVPAKLSPSQQTTAPAGGDWGFIQFSEVRAFRLNWDDEYSFEGLFLEPNKLNRNRLPKKGVRLNAEQIEQLHKAVTGSHLHLQRYWAAACFYPHHAFAFYNSDGKITGHIDICFLCSNYGGEPSGFAETWDLSALAILLKDLGIPLHNPAWD